MNQVNLVGLINTIIILYLTSARKIAFKKIIALEILCFQTSNIIFINNLLIKMLLCNLIIPFIGHLTIRLILSLQRLL